TLAGTQLFLGGPDSAKVIHLRRRPETAAFLQASGLDSRTPSAWTFPAPADSDPFRGRACPSRIPTRCKLPCCSPRGSTRHERLARRRSRQSDPASRVPCPEW